MDAAFNAAGNDLAAVIFEPVPANYGLLPQRREWLTYVAEKCRAHGALLVFDEVITGFRSGLTGAAGLFGITPDLLCFGKIIGGGFPVGAYGGRADLLKLVAPEGPVYQAGTLSANPVGMRAGLATLDRMVAEDGWRVLSERATTFIDALAGRLARIDPTITVVQHASLFWILRGATGAIRRSDRIPAAHAAWYAAFFHTALARGVYLPPSPYEVGFLSLAHDAATLALATDALVAAAEEVARQ